MRAGISGHMSLDKREKPPQKAVLRKFQDWGLASALYCGAFANREAELTVYSQLVSRS